ncbi:DUF2254 domain-containing protein [Dankookia rubra]|uniref:DUF2254 domain-containing protein n=1 Tax=Dankookia rubra TaxID=1442381 RepID=A0A4R5Q8H7_9PROT|nr:DUF2254 domain-containing protein [Dankookia rubra]TDH59254.1 DUF2254 domain-containing protein [Dankookia rubra]
MTGRFREWLEALGDIFWIRPSLLVLAGVVLGEVAVLTEQAGLTLPGVPRAWIYSGGEAGARALLSAVASSTIGVAGTTFSITVAALSLASGQMGPRLLRNFVRDRGNQLALGIFLGTFAYSLVVLRTVRSVDETAFVPHLGVTGALLLALACVGTLVWFVHHVATGINVETVIDLVHAELSAAVERLSRGDGEVADDPPADPPFGAAPAGRPVTLAGQGYLRAVDQAALADWAAGQGAVVVLLARPGAYIFPGAAVAEVAGAPAGEAAEAAIRAAFTLGARQAAAQDLEFAVRQLVEVATRALSPGINDPFTAIAVLDRLGATLCLVAPRRLPRPTVVREGRVVLHRQVTDYAGLCDAMFHMIRQSAAASPAVLIHLLETLGRVMAVERRAERQAELLRHAGLVVAAGRIGIADPGDLAALEARRPVPPRPGR